MKAPYEMTKSEWEAARETCRPQNIQSNFGRASGSQAMSKFNEMQRLCYGVRDHDHELLELAKMQKIMLDDRELEEVMDRMHRHVTWEEVVEKARKEGKI